MRKVIGSLAVVIGLLAFAPVSQAQSLGEVAAREKEKRKGRTGKSYSDDDLRKGGPSTTTTDTSAPAPSGTVAPRAGAPEGGGASSETGTTAEPDDRAEKEKAWRERWDKANATLDAARTEAARAEEAFNGAPDAVKPSYQNNMDQARKKLADAQAAVDKLDDERRFAGFRP